MFKQLKIYFTKWILILPLSFTLISSGCKESDTEKLTYGQVCSSKPTQTPKPPSEFVVNPESVKAQLFSQNTSILLGLNQVHQAKDEVNIARAQLLPSLNLSSLLYSSGSASTFTATAVEILFPFLVPGNWVKYDASKDLFKAQQYSIKAIELNSLASTLSIYSSILSDVRLRSIYSDESKDLEVITKLVKHLYEAGLASKSDLDRAQGFWQISQIGLSKVEGLIQGEISSFRHALGLDLKIPIRFTDFEPQVSEFETKSIDVINDQAFKNSPERLQIEQLILAAQKGVWSQRFAFISGVGMQSPGNSSTSSSIAFDNSSLGVQFNIGYAQVPMIELSQDRVKAVELRKKELQLEIAEKSEYAHNLIQEGLSRMEMTQKAEGLLKSVYERDLIRYRYGLLDLQSLLNTRSQFHDAKIESLRVKIQLDLDRIVLHRLVMGDQFSKLPDCQ